MATERTVINRYDHGGARIFIERENGSRDLVVDIYEPHERREAIIAALIASGIVASIDLPHTASPPTETA